MTTRKSSKKKGSKSTRTAAKKNKVKQPQTTERADLDRHPRPEREASGESMTFDSTRTDLDQHPRPTFQTSPVAPVTTEAIAARRVAAVENAPVCTRSKITTTGSNQDERDFPTFIGNFHKGLPHDNFGEVNPLAYKSLLKALNTPTQANFAAIQLGLGRKLTNPQAGLATDQEGPDPKDMKMRSAPKVNSAEAAAEAVELYWMALLRDVPFTQFETDTQIATAANELSGLTDFTGPKVLNQVTPRTIFRGCSPGVGLGPELHP